MSVDGLIVACARQREGGEPPFGLAGSSWLLGDVRGVPVRCQRALVACQLWRSSVWKGRTESCRSYRDRQGVTVGDRGVVPAPVRKPGAWRHLRRCPLSPWRHLHLCASETSYKHANVSKADKCPRGWRWRPGEGLDSSVAVVDLWLHSCVFALMSANIRFNRTCVRLRLILLGEWRRW